MRKKTRWRRLALDALDLVRNGLLVNLRFMSAAFARLAPPCPSPALRSPPMAAHLRFDPVTWARTYATIRPKLRAYLHTVLHCVFLHLYPARGIDPDSVGHRLRHGGGIGDRSARSSRHAHGPSGSLAVPSWNAWLKRPAS